MKLKNAPHVGLCINLKSNILAATLMAAITVGAWVCPTAIAQNQTSIKNEVLSVHLVSIDGVERHITELVEKRREKISKWNILRLKLGEEYVAYATTDSEYPVRLTHEQYHAHKKELKGVLDRRDYRDKHPYRTRVSDHYQRWGPVYNSAIGAGIGAAK